MKTASATFSRVLGQSLQRVIVMVLYVAGATALGAYLPQVLAWSFYDDHNQYFRVLGVRFSVSRPTDAQVLGIHARPGGHPMHGLMIVGAIVGAVVGGLTIWRHYQRQDQGEDE